MESNGRLDLTDQAIVTIEIGDIKKDFDIVDLQTNLNKLRLETGEADEGTLDGMRQWMAAQFGVEATTSQVVKLILAIDAMYLRWKKKQDEWLESHFGSESIRGS